MEKLKRKLRLLGVDTSNWIFGRGCKRRKKGGGREDRYELSSTNICDNTFVAIQYCKDIGQYIAWIKPHYFGRNHLSVVSNNVPIVKNENVLSTRKGKEFVWNDNEKVYTFNEKGIESFVKIFST